MKLGTLNQMNLIRHTLGLMLALCYLLINGCALLQERLPNDDSIESMQQQIDEVVTDSRNFAPSPGTPPPEVAAALLPPMSMENKTPSFGPREARFDVQVNRLNARQFFMSLVNGTPLNMVVHNQVRGNISLTLKNVSLDEIMNTVRNIYGYEYIKTSNGYEVLPRALRTEIFNVNYLALQRRGQSQTNVRSGEVGAPSSSSGSNNQNNSSNSTLNSSNGSGASSNNQTGNDSGLGSSQVITDSESDFWQELTNALNLIIGNQEGRQVVVTPHAGVVVIKAYPDELRRVGTFLNKTQDAIRRQVILEAKILEVELDENFQSGINWATLADSASVLASQTGGGTAFKSSFSDTAGQTGNLNPGLFSPIDSTLASAFGGIFSLGIKLDDFSAFIELLQTQGKVHVLSSPRVSTVNNQKAVIKVGSDEFFVTDFSSQSDTANETTNNTVDVELTPFFSGVALDVIPQIDEHDAVTLHIHPVISEVKEEVKNINISNETAVSVPLAKSKIRESDSIVRAQSGQVVVIGGLMQNSSSTLDAGIPGLSQLPLLGRLFSHQKKSYKKSELVILLKPIVVSSHQIWTNNLNQSAERLTDVNRVQRIQSAL